MWSAYREGIVYKKKKSNKMVKFKILEPQNACKYRLHQ